MVPGWIFREERADFFFIFHFSHSRSVWAKRHEIWGVSEQHTGPLHSGDDREGYSDPQQEPQRVLSVCGRWVSYQQNPHFKLYEYHMRKRGFWKGLEHWFLWVFFLLYEGELIMATTMASPNWLWQKRWCSTEPSSEPHSWPESRTPSPWSLLTTPTSSPSEGTLPGGIPSSVWADLPECIFSCEAGQWMV